MAEYCSVDDVKQTLSSWEELGGTGEDAIINAKITAAIVEATEQVRTDIRPRYTVAQIDALSPTFPPGIVNITKYRASILLLQQYGQVTGQQSEVILPNLQTEVNFLLKMIQYGTLLDASGVAVPLASEVSSLTQQPYAKELDAHYADGVTREYV